MDAPTGEYQTRCENQTSHDRQTEKVSIYEGDGKLYTHSINMAAQCKSHTQIFLINIKWSIVHK